MMLKRRQISHFLTPSVKIRGGVSEISIPIVEALPVAAERGGLIKRKRKEGKKKVHG